MAWWRRKPATSGAILHLAFPVRDLDEARSFYVDLLGCQPGRATGEWIDVWFHGCQVTLHHRPTEVLPAVVRGVRHFGVSLDLDQFERLVLRYQSVGVPFTEHPHVDESGTHKAKVEDPSGNVIEFKSYPNVEAALSPPAGLMPL